MAAATGALCLIVLAATLGAESTSRASVGGAKAAKAAPNFVLILSDDQAQNTFNRKFMPRTFRQIVDHGTRFTDGLAAPPLCCPDRAGLLTGQYPHNHGVFSNHPGYPDLKDPQDTLPVWLHNAGYRTGYIGKFLNHYADVGGASPAPGFDRWFSYVGDPHYYDYNISDDGIKRSFGSRRGDYSTDVFTHKAVSFIHKSSKRRRKPFFLWLGYNAPHGSRSTFRPCRFPSSAVPPTGAAYRRFLHVPLPRPGSFNERDVSDKPAAIRKLPLLDRKATAKLRQQWHCALGAVSEMDKGVERVMTQLRRDHELNRTIVMYLSDNGVFFGEHRRVGGKSDIYEPALNVPYAIRVPPAYRSRRRAQRSQAVVSNQDIAPTMLAYAQAYLGPILTCGGPADCRRMDGRSLKPLLGGRGRWRSGRGVLAEINTGAKDYHAVRTHRYVYSQLTTGERELYDLKRDPQELRNRDGHHRYARVEHRLAARLAKLRDCSGIRGRDPQTLAPFCD